MDERDEYSIARRCRNWIVEAFCGTHICDGWDSEEIPRESNA